MILHVFIQLFYVISSLFYFLLSNKEQSINLIQQRLLLSFKKFSKDLNIPICYCSSESIGKENTGKLRMFRDENSCNSIIFISEDKKNNPYILGHELGHYFARMSDNDKSEVRANYYLSILLATTLTSFEWFILNKKISVILNNMNIFIKCRTSLLKYYYDCGVDFRNCFKFNTNRSNYEYQ